MTWLSREELEKIARFSWTEDDIEEFISELIVFSPKERLELLDDMLEKSQVKYSKRYIKIYPLED